MRQISLFQGYNSKDIFFEIKGKGKGQKIIMEKSEMETEIVNDTTIKAIFKTGQVAGIFDVRWVLVWIVFLFTVKTFICQMQDQYQIRGQGDQHCHGLGRGQGRRGNSAERRLWSEDSCGMWVEILFHCFISHKLVNVCKSDIRLVWQKEDRISRLAPPPWRQNL